MKINAFNHVKSFLGLLVALMIIGITILCVFGFNKGQEFAGRIEINAKMGVYNIVEENDVKEFTDRVVKVIKDNGGKVLQTNVEDDSFDAVLVVSVKLISTDRNENIKFANDLKTKIDEEFNDDLLITSSKYESGILSNPSVINLAYITLFAIIISMIYLIARIKLLNTMCVLATSIVSVILYILLIVITRVEVNTNIVGLVLITAIMGFILPSIKFFDLKNNKDSKVTMDDCFVTVKSLTAKLLLIAIVPMLVLVIMGTPIVRSYALAVIISLVSVYLADSLVKMPLCYYLTYFTTAKNKPQKIEKVMPVKTLENSDAVKAEEIPEATEKTDDTTEETEEATEETTEDNNN